MGKPHLFVARSPMPAPAARLFAWHARPGALERLQPPWSPARVLARSGEGLLPGARVVMRMRVGGVPLRFVAEHTAYEAGHMFQDTLREGPFARWVHTHVVHPEGEGASVLEDRVEYALPFGRLGEVGRPFARAELRRLFAWRHALTRLDLTRHAGTQPLSVAVVGADTRVGRVLVPFLSTGGHAVQVLDGGGVLRPAFGGSEVPGALDALVHVCAEPDEEAHAPAPLEEVLCQLGRPPRTVVSVVPARAPTPWRPTSSAHARFVRLRCGAVLTGAGGVLPGLVRRVRLGLAPALGAWVALEDVVGAVLHALVTPGLEGEVTLEVPPPAVAARTMREVLAGRGGEASLEAPGEAGTVPLQLARLDAALRLTLGKGLPMPELEET